MLAEIFDCDGLNYEIVGESLCRVAPTPDATGNIEIPSSVNYDNVIYDVIGVSDRAFANCTGLKTVLLPSSVTAIGEEAFTACHSLKVIEISDNVTTIGDQAFSGCTSLLNIRLGGNVSDFGHYVFMGCTALTTLDISEGLSTIAKGCFLGCSSLSIVSFPTSLTTIDAEAFADCKSLTRVSLPSSVQAVGRKSFYNCPEVKTIVLGSGLTEIGTQAFDDCNAVDKVISYSAKPPVAGMYAFDSEIYGNATLIVPVGCRPAYRNTFPYQEFSEIEEDDNPEERALLYVRFPQKGAIATEEHFGERITFKLEAEEGWDIASICFNGEDFSEAISESGYFTTPQITCDSELDVVFKKSSGVTQPDADNGIKITIHRNTIRIDGAGDSSNVRIYSIGNGQLLYDGFGQTITLDKKGAFLLTVSGQTFKFSI